MSRPFTNVVAPRLEPPFGRAWFRTFASEVAQWESAARRNESLRSRKPVRSYLEPAQ